MFDGKLEEPVLIVQSSSRAKMNALGWFTLGRVWENKETGKTFHEITIAAEALNAPMYSILEVLVHEMGHYWCKENGIKDCSANQYHNKEFKKAANRFWLLTEDKPHPRYGYGLTKASDELKTFFDMINLDESAFEISMKEVRPNKGTSNMNIYLCEGCGKSFKTVVHLSSASCAGCGGTYFLK